MEFGQVSRRGLMLGAAGVAAAQQAENGLTAGQVIERIKSNVGVAWRQETVDKIVAGNASTPVRGIATTMMATLDVLQRAAAAGRNLVITHESTFYSHQDTVDQLTRDSTYQFKVDFIAKNQMVVFHLHDHWHARRPDGIAEGMIRELGWVESTEANQPRIFSFPATRLDRFAKDMASRLKIRTMRVLGDPALEVKRVIASWGYVSQLPGIALLARPDIDVMVAGETREWEVVEYAQDAISAGRKKGLILMGHVVSEQAGMKYCAEWLKPIVPEVPVEFVAASEPFWMA
jgi:putative NIF3 family GTP cyclohydrolase 1 type 2